jgi:hypothetical protein
MKTSYDKPKKLIQVLNECNCLLSKDTDISVKRILADAHLAEGQLLKDELP